MKSIGVTFPDELSAAGLSGLPFAYASDGTFTFSTAMTPDQINEVMAVYAAHDPSAVPAPTVPSPFDVLVAKLRDNPTAVAAIEQAYQL